MRKSDIFFLFLALCFFLLSSIFIHASITQKTEMESIKDKMELAKRLQLTDLCLFTEANYTRHLSQADLHTPFQDSPMSLEHFPSGALVEPPKNLRKTHERVD